MLKKMISLFCFIPLILAGCGTEAPKESKPIQLETKSGDYAAALEITPGQAGPNQYMVTITDAKGEVQKEGKAVLHFSMQGMEHGKSEKELQIQADGKWHGQGPQIMMPGSWQIQLEWSKASGEKQGFDYAVTLEE